MLKIILVILLIAIFAAFGWIFYPIAKLEKTGNSSEPHSVEKIKLGVSFWPGDLGLYIADELNFFEEEGVEVELKDYKDLKQISVDYVKGELTGRANISFDVLNETEQGFKQKIVGLIDYSNGSDGIIAKQGIENMGQVKGMRVAYEVDTLEEFLLRFALDQYDLTLEDIITVNLNGEEAVQAIGDGSVDLAVTYEPFLSKGVEKPGVHLIYSSANAPGLISDVLTFPDEFIQKYPDQVEAVLRAYFRGIDFAEQNPERANEIVAKRLGDTQDEIKKQLSGVVLGDRQVNKSAFTYAAGTTSLYGSMKRGASYRFEKSGKQIDTDSLIDSQFIKKLIN